MALYRKYRPQAFADVLGQEHVVSVLAGAVANNAFAHAYLFAGSRGTGKTSVARIFAHAIGCSENDLHEIDAASNRGIDDIRELREAVTALPFESSYKVYIIDEVHMLTKEAFNALLKTLEEPPAHMVFILATTEQGKLPETIVSRCQTFTFKKPSQSMLRKLARDVAKKEGRSIDAGAADLIAVLSDGSFRDAHGMLQKVFAATEASEEITQDIVARIAGAPQAALVNDVITAIAAGDRDTGLRALETAASQNIDMQVFATLVLHKLRVALLLKHAPELGAELAAELSQEDADFLKETAADTGNGINAAALAALLDAYTQTARAAVPQLPLELALIDLTDTEHATSTA